MPMLRKITRAGRTIFQEEYFSGRWGKKGRGSPPVKPSTEEIRKCNARRQEKELAKLMNANFRPGVDALVTLEWYRNKEPADLQGMQKDAASFIRTLKRWYRKGHQVWEEVADTDEKGKPKFNPDGTPVTKKVKGDYFGPKPELKYIYTMEEGPRGCRHIHILLSDVDREEVKKAWKKYGDHPDVQWLWDDGNYKRIANYFMKYAGKTERTEEKQGKKLGRRWNASENLVRPQPRVYVISPKSFEKDFPARDGYYIDQESVRAGADTDQNGRPYRECIYVLYESIPAKESAKPLTRRRKTRRTQSRKQKTYRRPRSPGRRKR